MAIKFVKNSLSGVTYAQVCVGKKRRIFSVRKYGLKNAMRLARMAEQEMFESIS